MLAPRAAGLLLVGAATAAAAAPRGRVVRVERGTAAAVPRLCAMAAIRDQNLCFGRPREGERVAIIDLSEKRVRGEFVIESVEDSAELAQLRMCVDTGVQTVKGSYRGGAEGGEHVVGLRGARLDPRTARVLSDVAPPSGRAEESVEVAIDADGNGRADLILTEYGCDATGAPASGTGARCFDTYLEQRGVMRRVQRDILRACP
jgi:hypothetical protein